MDDDIWEIIEYSDYLKKNSNCRKCKINKYFDCSCNKSKYGDLDPEPIEIFPNIFLGSILFMEDDDWLDENNIECVINMTQNDYLDNGIVLFREFEICHLPSYDKKDFPILAEYGEKAYYFVKNKINENKNIFIHCHMGYNRSACIASYVVWRLSNNSMKEVIKHILECRPCVFTNISFIKQLFKMEQLFLTGVINFA